MTTLSLEEELGALFVSDLDLAARRSGANRDIDFDRLCAALRKRIKSSRIVYTAFDEITFICASR
jgi:hypothetical protein